LIFSLQGFAVHAEAVGLGERRGTRRGMGALYGMKNSQRAQAWVRNAAGRPSARARSART
jgi:hypothetical protein